MLDRFDTAGQPIVISDLDSALREGEKLHRYFRPNIEGDYLAYMRRMAQEGAHVMHLVDEGEVRALAVWRDYLTTYCGRRFEIDDLVTDEAHRSQGYGATIMRCLEAKAAEIGADAVMLVSATHRTHAHRFYFRERFLATAFLFQKDGWKRP